MLCQIPFQTLRVVFPASRRRFTRCEGFNIHAHKTLPVQCRTSSQSRLSYPCWYHPDTAATSCSVLCPCWYHPDIAATSCSVLCPCWYHPDTAATSYSVLCYSVPEQHLLVLSDYSLSWHPVNTAVPGILVPGDSFLKSQLILSLSLTIRLVHHP